MGSVFSKAEHMERVEKFNEILSKITEERNITRYELFNEVKVNIFYMEKFLNGQNPNFPNTKVLERIAEVSGSIVTYEELVILSGYSKANYMKQVNPEREIKKHDIFFADLGQGVGSEQLGERPVLVIQNDLGNKFAPTLIVAPITSNINKAKLPTHIVLSQSASLEKTSVVLFEQMRTIDKSRLKYFIGKISNEEDKRKADVAFKQAGGCYTFGDQLLEKLETVDETSKTQLGVFKKLFNILLNKYKNKELKFNNRTA